MGFGAWNFGFLSYLDLAIRRADIHSRHRRVMLCCICKENEASVHLTQIVYGRTQTIEKAHLCAECASRKGVNDPRGFSLANLLSEGKQSATDARNIT